jgi:hypothetical protein
MHDVPRNPNFGKAAGWQRRMDAELAKAVNNVDFDLRFVRHLLTILDQGGFSNVAHAILGSVLDLARGHEDREEFDALVDLGIQLMSRDDRPFAGVVPLDD